MEDTEDLLNSWGLPELVAVFTKQEISIHALSALSETDIRELIPRTGPRVLFLRCWKTWRSDFTSRSCNSSLPDLSEIIDLENFDSNNIIIENEENVAPIHSSTGTEHVQVILPSSVTTQNTLELLLESSIETAVLLTSKGGSLSGDSARNLLASTIAREILSQKNTVINGAIYYKWACFIKDVFPGERTTTYYIPACTTANGISIQARGKLVHQVLNKRRRLQVLGALPRKRSRSSSQSSSKSNPSPRPLPPFITEDEDEENNVAVDVQWLESSSSPWCLVEERWKRTVKQRLRSLHETNESVEAYFAKYPALKTPHGYLLLQCDFDAAHQINKNNLFINFPLVKRKLQELLKLKKGSEAFLQELLKLFDSSNEEHSNLAGFLAIPSLLNSSTVRQKKKKRGSSEGCHTWKPSKAEVRDGFIKHIKDDCEIAQTIELRLATLKNKGSPSQPYIIVVGESLEKIKTYFVVANGSILYESSSIIQAVDTCYKIVWSLNVEYGVDTYPVWYFIQRGLYKMTSKFDKGSTAAESLLTDCNL